MKRQRILKLLFLIFAFYLFAHTPVLAKIYINEFSSASTDDWIEFYNDSDQQVDLSQFKIRDNTSSNSFDLSGNIQAKSFATFDWYNKLNKDGDLIRLLYKSDESLIEDQVGYGDVIPINPAPSTLQTLGRKPNGAGAWTLLSQASKNLSNDDVPIGQGVTPTSTPEPTPTKTPTPTHTPTPTKIPTPTRTPTSIKVTSSATNNSATLPTTALSNSSSVLGTTTKRFSPSPDGERQVVPTAILGKKAEITVRPNKVLVKDATKENNSPPIVIYLMFAGGALCMAICGILIYQNKRAK